MNTFYVDTREELSGLVDIEQGDICYVIEESAKYMANSEGEWICQTGNGSADGAYATEEFVMEEISKLEIPSIDGLASELYVNDAIASLITEKPALKMFDEDPEIMASNPGSKFGIALNNGDTRTLPEAMLEKGVGMYNFWVHKSNQSLPEEAFAKNSSCRGLCCVDTVKTTGWYGWIILFDQDGEMYVQYIRNSVPKGWKKSVSSDAFLAEMAKLKNEKYEFSTLPVGTIVDRSRGKEIRIFCPEDAQYKDQTVGEGGNPNMYYMTFTTYAPEGAVAFREGDKGVLVDEILNFQNTAGTGTDKYGRKFKHHWFALASKDAFGNWNYFGKTSTKEKFIGWNYIVEWYDANGKVIDTDAIRINLSNKDCHNSLAPYYGNF